MAEALWDLRATIENFKVLQNNAEIFAKNINMDGKADSDVDEIRFDFGQAIRALEVLAELDERNLTVEHILNYAQFEDEYVEKGFTFKTLLEARGKETPFKPMSCKITLGRCKCGVGFLDKTTNYCGNCGQKLDWSVGDETD